MSRLYSLGLIVLTAAAPSSSSIPAPDLIETARLAATLDDWRAILLFALFITTMLLFVLVWVIWQVFSILRKSAEATAAHAAALNAVNVTLARIESRVMFP